MKAVVNLSVHQHLPATHQESVACLLTVDVVPVLMCQSNWPPVCFWGSLRAQNDSHCLGKEQIMQYVWPACEHLEHNSLHA